MRGPEKYLSRESLRVLDTLMGLKPLKKDPEPENKAKAPFPWRALAKKGEPPLIPHHEEKNQKKA